MSEATTLSALDRERAAARRVRALERRLIALAEDQVDRRRVSFIPDTPFARAVEIVDELRVAREELRAAEERRT